MGSRSTSRMATAQISNTHGPVSGQLRLPGPCPSDQLAPEADAWYAACVFTMAAVSGGTVTVLNFGSHNSQPDSAYLRVLEQMGCTVSQTDASTTVSSNGPLQAVDLDLSQLEHTFLTAAVAASVADGTSTFKGLTTDPARLDAMVSELAKCGVCVTVLPDSCGFQVAGQTAEWITACSNTAGTHIDCHGDSHIATSMALLGVVSPFICIDNGSCMQQASPEFWQAVQDSLQIQVKFDPPTCDHTTPLQNKVVIVIGMRGAGKTSVSKMALQHFQGALEWVDMDDIFEADGMPIKELIAGAGWGCFRAMEASSLDKQLRVVSKSATKMLISCGGGIIETPAGRGVLAQAREQGAHILWLRRPIEQIEKYLMADASRPSVGDIQEVYARRRPLYDDASTVAFDNTGGEACCVAFAELVANLLAHKTQ